MLFNDKIDDSISTSFISALDHHFLRGIFTLILLFH